MLVPGATIRLGDADGSGAVEDDETPTALLINSEVDVIGPGADVLTIDASGADRVLDIGAAIADISGLTLTGASAAGEAIYAAAGSDLTLDAIEVAGNQGDGVYARGDTLTIENSTIAENIGIGVAVSGQFPSGPQTAATINNTTISGNSGVDYQAGGLRVFFASAVLTNVTIAKNHGGSLSGGIYADYASTVTLHNSLVADNTTNSTSHSPDLGGSGGNFSSSSSYNLIGIVDNATLAARFSDDNGNQVGSSTGLVVEAKISPLDYYGGATRTHALEPDSPAIDAGDPSFTDPGRHRSTWVGILAVPR